MAEEQGVVTISSTPVLGPDEIERRTFPGVRKGIDPASVRAFLSQVAEELRATLERETALRRSLADAERRAEDPVLDEATLSRAIGAETGRILESAHQAAHEVLNRAETRSSEQLADAERIYAERTAAAQARAAELLEGVDERVTALTDSAREAAQQLTERASRDAATLVSRAHEESEALIEAAHRDAVALLDATKDECREMVVEARALRTRVLADLQDRRRGLRVQLEQLRTGKNSLIEVIEAVDTAVDELRERLAGAEDEARLAAGEAAQRAALQTDTDDLDDLDQELAALASHEAAGSQPREPAGAGGSSDGSGEEGAAAPATRRSVDDLFARIRAERAGEELRDDEVLLAEATLATEAVETVVSQEAGDPGEAEEKATGVGDDESASRSGTKDLAPEAHEPDSENPTPDTDALARRDELLSAAVVKLSRGLKRALQDDQNELLNGLRQAATGAALESILPHGAQQARYVTACVEALGEARAAGVAFVSAEAAEGPADPGLTGDEALQIASELAGEITSVLRARVERALADAGDSAQGAADAAGAAYREWKGNRVEQLAGDFATRSFASGQLAGLGQSEPGGASGVRWVALDEGDSGTCPDCDDNSLAGVLRPGEEFPTGHMRPPVHPGCRCLLVTVGP